MASIPNVSRKAAGPYIADLRPFNSNHFHARTVLKGETIGSWGDLPTWWVAALKFDQEANGVYVVWSYDTPIAWCFRGNGKWTIPSVWYSNTTIDHVQVVSAAIRDSGKWLWDDMWNTDHPHSAWRYLRPNERPTSNA